MVQLIMEIYSRYHFYKGFISTDICPWFKFQPKFEREELQVDLYSISWEAPYRKECILGIKNGGYQTSLCLRKRIHFLFEKFKNYKIWGGYKPLHILTAVKRTLWKNIHLCLISTPFSVTLLLVPATIGGVRIPGGQLLRPLLLAVCDFLRKIKSQ